eukprot:6207765-Pleurochrysis_carterae.AAC.2
MHGVSACARASSGTMPRQHAQFQRLKAPSCVFEQADRESTKCEATAQRACKEGRRNVCMRRMRPRARRNAARSEREVCVLVRTHAQQQRDSATAARQRSGGGGGRKSSPMAVLAARRQLFGKRV